MPQHRFVLIVPLLQADEAKLCPDGDGCLIHKLMCEKEMKYQQNPHYKKRTKSVELDKSH